MSSRGARHDRHRGEPGGTALVVVDMLNPYRHAEAERLAVRAGQALPAIETLLARAAEAELPVVRSWSSRCCRARITRS